MFWEHDRGYSSDEKRKPGGSKKALIIAVSDYGNRSKLNQLSYCKNDGEAVYDVLKSQYEIPEKWRLIGTVSGQEIATAIYDFFRESARENDTLLFYFSGHGVHDDFGDTFLGCSDLEHGRRDPTKNAYAFKHLEDDAITKTHARNVIVILDCCYAASADLGKSGDDLVDRARGHIEKVFKQGNGKCILASSLEAQSSFKKKDKPYSLFTYHLLDGLKGGGGLSVDDYGNVTPQKLSRYIYNAIPISMQKPVIKYEMSGDIVIASYPELAKPDDAVQREYDDLYQYLRDGDYEVFNHERKAHVDLRGRDLKRRNLPDVNLSNSNLVGADMREANLRRANFSSSDLAGAFLEFADLREANFKGANLSGASFDFALLSGAKMDVAARHSSEIDRADFLAKANFPYSMDSQTIYETNRVPSRNIAVGGFNVRYLSYEKPLLASGMDEPTILLHGLIGSAENWLLMTPSLSRYLKLVVPDILGFGLSDKPRRKYDLDFFMKFLSGFMKNLSVRKANIVAMSFGARLAIEFAIRFPALVNKLVICSPAIIPPGFDCIDWTKKTMCMNVDDIIEMFMNANNNRETDGGRVANASARIFERMIKQPGLHHSYQSSLCDLMKYPDLTLRLPQISAPTLVVWGVDDKIADYRYAGQFRAIPNSRLVTIKDCGHYVSLQKPVEFNKAILDFLIAQ